MPNSTKPRQAIIVKVQISLMTNAGKPQVLVYDKDNEHFYQGDAPKDILKAMKGEPKKFFYADLPDYGAGIITLVKEAPWQNW